MSLRDELEKLREVARSLNNAKFDVELPALKKFVDNLNILRDIKPPEDFLQELLIKFLGGEENFSRRELKALPFLIYEREITLSDVKKFCRS